MAYPTDLVERFTDPAQQSSFPAHWGLTFTKTVHNNLYPSIEPSKFSRSFSDAYTVVVVGASQGIGEYIARAYAEAGVKNIVLMARNENKLQNVKVELEKIAKGEIKVSIVIGDATKPESYTEFAEVIAKSYGGRIDCLVCNAGGGYGETLWEPKLQNTSPEEFMGLTEINYHAAFLAAQKLVPFVVESEGKTVINITSAACHMVDMPPYGYSIAKLALNRFTESLAAIYKDEGLLAVALHPGTVVTPGVEERAPHLIPMLKDDVRLCAGVCSWLGATRPQWLSGRYMAVNWDVDELFAMRDEIVNKDKLKFRMVV
ncbi:Short chain dehydrogenase citE [Pseudocercospora fuligena]|uniref:Short chain dehydrogenase citE n=1 Tax=Pseudocercospora fuligena TaxID=685502 RepID=A0A8H6R9V9_9PEZI|nr:Short chain dehydrogenase citE [Pseudocercospora fuligena]